MSEAIKTWAVGDDNKAEEFIKGGYWEIGFEKNEDGFNNYIKGLNDLSVNDIVFLKSKYVAKGEAYGKIFAIGVIKNKISEKRMCVNWIVDYSSNEDGFKRVDGTLYAKTLQIVNEPQKLLGESLETFLVKHNLKSERGEKIFAFNNTKSNSTEAGGMLNQILYGPPGTGKTYNTINKALKIIDGRVPDDRKEAKKRFDELKNSGQIVFTTFHQSYGYEEFVEGIKPKLDDSSKEEMGYEIVDGIFKSLAESALNNFEASKVKNQTIENSCLNSFIAIVEEQIANAGKYTIKHLEPHMVNFSIVEIRRKKNDEFMSFVCKNNNGNAGFALSKEVIVRDFESFVNGEIKSAKDLKPRHESKQTMLGNGVYYFGLFQSMLQECKSSVQSTKTAINHKEENKNYILIIDEINRGNISKIFGELITLIEDSKRIGADEEIKVTLPYSGDEFGVPQNLYIIGTMNTADRSIALMDTALRRRFHFEEMMPDYEVLEGLKVDDIQIKEMLQTINKRIEYLYDRDHTIGHAYFMSLQNKDDKEAKAELDNIFRNKIIPLLQEYFYDDWEKIQMVLGDHPEQLAQDEDKFIKSTPSEEKKIFGFNHDDIEDKKVQYKINSEFTPSTYTKIYTKA